MILGPEGTDSEFFVGTLDIAIPLETVIIPNTLFMYAVENSRWNSESFEVVQTGNPGGISASTFNLGVVAMGLTVRINGQVVQLFGSGEYFVDAGFRLILFKVNLTGSDYTVTLTAISREAQAPSVTPLHLGNFPQAFTSGRVGSTSETLAPFTTGDRLFRRRSKPSGRCLPRR